ncbi:VOC family protein [Pacificimonas sp. WHA3]|uniref:VOC family protein n=1 Tax=Pacificimonas pallii TaxID=2827236 RepID=A0ABS6SGC6_9SPHN|nr:VOC family protein [Pacificimonas pallii]MBV7257483.1 VOC family protein [Pacificimonas pallii]
MTINQAPIFKRVDHVSLTVSDLEAALGFYTDVMGARQLYRMGPFDAAEIPPMEDGRDWTDAHVNVPGARLEIAMVELADNLRMELFAYAKPDNARTEPPRNCDVGSRHLCLEVEDVEATVGYMVKHGCRAMAGPIRSEDGPGDPSLSWYILDPFGHQLELVEYL